MQSPSQDRFAAAGTLFSCDSSGPADIRLLRPLPLSFCLSRYVAFLSVALELADLHANLSHKGAAKTLRAFWHRLGTQDTGCAIVIRGTDCMQGISSRYALRWLSR